LLSYADTLRNISLSIHKHKLMHDTQAEVWGARSLYLSAAMFPVRGISR
jgi:hypothetical protein